MAYSSPSLGLTCLIIVLCCASPVLCFGAGDIASTSRIEGQNWRHGDIENTLLTLLTAHAAGGKKFSKLDVKRIYFGNWLRDYSQAVDVGTVKYVSAEAIRILLWVLGFMSFGYGTKEFEVTTARLGCYRPEEHIDNPKNYADNEDARQYDRRLRGPIDERRELSIDENTGMKNYIANERAGIDTSAGLLRKLFGRSVQLGRQYGRSKNKDDLYEALRLLGTGLHCLEDYSAHSNFVELALIELGEREVFPHVGRRTQVQLRGLRNPVYPICTGTFGGVDFLHSVMGEFNDKATQSEIQELESTMNHAQNNKGSASALQDLLDKIPDGIFGSEGQGKKADDLKQNAQAHQMQNTRISPRQPEEWLRYLNDTQKQIFPVLEWHDDIMKSITETIDKIPILPDLIEQMQDELNVFVFSILAPYVMPIINQVKSELNTGSNEIIQSSVAQQHIVFRDDNCSDPTHSMLSKDHFSNVLNEPAGKVASQVLKWVVPQLIACWDDDGIDVERTVTRIVNGVFHHPALRDQGQDGASDGRRQMFGIVEQWWMDQSEREKDGLREQLSRRGVESGRNHKPGVVDHGHGCNKPLGLPTLNTAQSSTAVGGPAASAVMSGISEALGGDSDDKHKKNKSSGNDKFGKMAGDAVGGGALGSIVGGIAGGLLGGAFGGDEKKTKKTEKHGEDGSYSQTQTEYGQSGSHYGQAQYSSVNEPGGRAEQYTRYEQKHGGSGGYGAQQFTETARYDNHGNQTYHHQESSSTGGYGSETRHQDRGGRGSSPYNKKKDKSDGDSGDDYKKQKKHEKKERKQRKKYGGKRDSDDNYDDSEDSNDSGKKKHGNQYGGSGSQYGSQRTSGYDGGRESGYGGDRRHDDGSGGSRQTGGYGRQDDNSSGRHGRDDTYGRSTSGYQHESSGGGGGGNTYGRDTGSGYGGGGTSYGQDTGSGYGSGNTYGRATEGSYGGGGGNTYGQSSGQGGYNQSNQGSYGDGGGNTYGQSSGQGGYNQGNQGSYGRDESYGGGGAGGYSGGGGGYGGGSDQQQMPGGFGNDDDGGGYGGSGGGGGGGGGYGNDGERRRRYDGGY